MQQHSRIGRRIVLVGLVLFLLVVASVQLTFAQSPETPDTKVKLDLVDYRGGEIQSLFASQAYIYTNFGIAFTILEQVDDTTFRRVGYTLIGDDISDIYVDGQHAYISGQMGLHIIDISDPANPQVVAHLELGAVSDSIVVAGGYAYLGGTGFAIIDVSDPARPALVHRRCCDVVGTLAVQEDLLYVPQSTQGLQVYNVGNPGNPTLLGTYDPPGTPIDLSVRGDLAYLTTSLGFEIVDVADPAAPTRLGYTTYENAEGRPSAGFALIIDGQYAYVAASGGRLWVIDTNVPSAPRTAGLVGLPVTDDHLVAPALTKAGDQLYVAAYQEGLIALEVSEPEQPQHVTTAALYAVPSSLWHVNANASYLYTGNAIFDISEPDRPGLVGAYPGDIQLIEGATGYGATASLGFQILDLSNPITPTVSATYNVTTFWKVAVSNDHAYVVDRGQCGRGGCSFDGLHIIDISAPTQPRGIAFKADFVPDHIMAQGNYLYASQDGSFNIYDISDPAILRKVASYTPPEPGRSGQFDLVGSLVFLATHEGGLRILDLLDPAEPVEVGRHASYAAKVQVAGKHAYVVTTGRLSRVVRDTLHVIDITDVTNPQSAGQYIQPQWPVLPSEIYDLTVTDDYIYSTGAGLFTLHQQEIELPLRTYLPVSSVADR